MQEALKRLLEAEAHARALIAQAGAERQRMLDESLEEARQAQARFEQEKATLRAPFLAEARIRAEQTVAELGRKFDDRQKALRDMTAQHEQLAVKMALAFLLDPEH